ncbi:hypothetical protein FHT02_003306 [Sphingomonas xinjiangensis]|uniref:Uncharacterized protein n=1 Tax=Sphingomonas xinjiangensis TaxID=643568 RepID=A0A840YPA5_9SPHN|nr:hypothetical protein [Sphingomonas xinjiangensis]
MFDKKAQRDGTFARSDLTHEHVADSYMCPGGKRLRARNRNFATRRSGVGQDGSIRYRARQQDCAGCHPRQRSTRHDRAQGHPLDP